MPLGNRWVFFFFLILRWGEATLPLFLIEILLFLFFGTATRHVKSSFPHQGWTHAACSGSAESQLMDLQGSSYIALEIRKTIHKSSLCSWRLLFLALFYRGPKRSQLISYTVSCWHIPNANTPCNFSQHSPYRPAFKRLRNICGNFKGAGIRGPATSWLFCLQPITRTPWVSAFRYSSFHPVSERRWDQINYKGQVTYNSSPLKVQMLWDEHTMNSAYLKHTIIAFLNNHENILRIIWGDFLSFIFFEPLDGAASSLPLSWDLTLLLCDYSFAVFPWWI